MHVNQIYDETCPKLFCCCAATRKNVEITFSLKITFGKSNFLVKSMSTSLSLKSMYLVVVQEWERETVERKLFFTFFWNMWCKSLLLLLLLFIACSCKDHCNQKRFEGGYDSSEFSTFNVKIDVWKHLLCYLWLCFRCPHFLVLEEIEWLTYHSRTRNFILQL